ncbi:MAG: hypothetical protein H6810_08780 [Phycisphaeraceae bacterium]|nr:MAG: hypothetical protein H6810_08780 [Phycisphaeraceae bacterium]
MGTRVGFGVIVLGVGLLSTAVTAASGQSGLPYNRSMTAGDVRLEENPEPTPDRPFLMTGLVHYDAEPVGTFDLSCSIAVFVNGEYAGGGPGAGGTCGDPGGTQRITVAPGIQISGNPPLFDCTLFCSTCNGSDFNFCNPPGVSPGALCFCQQECIPFRVVGGFGVPVGQLDPDDLIEIALAVYDTGLPEIDTSDDSIAMRAGDAMPCPADLDGNRLLDLRDISAFIDGFLGGDPIADLSGDGVFDLVDVGAFVESFLAGCP